MNVPSFGPYDDPQRRMPRHSTDVVNCPVGKILDLSGSGMRVEVKGKCPLSVGQCIPLKLKTPNGSISVRARAVWRKRTGLFSNYQLGFQFEGITPGQTVALATIARFGFITSENVSAYSGKKPQGDAQQSDAGDRSQHKAKPLGSSPASVEASIVLSEYYQRLGVKPDATANEVKKAFHNLARKYHPDVAPGPENHKRFVEAREAYDLITNHLKIAG